VATRLGVLIALGMVVVILTRVVVRGIELYAASGGMSAKSKGQFLGYATSLPELVGTVGTAGNGLLAAGLWNIGASNIINVGLFIIAATWYRRTRCLLKRKFFDEGMFAFAALCIPLVLARYDGVAGSPWTAAGLFGLFVSYVYLDKKLNPNPPPSMAISRGRRDNPGRPRAVAIMVVGVLGLVATGYWLGEIAEVVVEGMGVPQWAVGWILGVITSLPEMTAFFAVFASRAEEGIDEADDTDCQENLDSLAASNMSNLGLIYPIGITVFLLVGSL